MALTGFGSKNEELNNFLQGNALEYQHLNLGTTYLLFGNENELISYITLAMGALKIPDKKEFIFRGKKLLDYPKEFPQQLPALLVGKLATDKRHENRGGAGLLLDYALKTAFELREKIGCTYLLAQVYTESVSWYQQKGFKTHIRERNARDTSPMYFEL